MIGGATTSELHVALKIAPVYGGPVVWMKDASQNPIIAAQLLNTTEGRNLDQTLSRRYQQLRDDYETKQKPLASIDEARKNKLNLF